MRNVIIHYHLFKNAGSSIDALLEKSFGDKWYSFDPVDPAGKISSVSLSENIESHPEMVAFSSHCIVPPLPEGDFTPFPIVVVRDPIARVMSAYLFEWKKQMGLDKPRGSLSEYIEEKFSKPRANAIEDFQTIRLSVSDREKTSPILKKHDELILNDAKEFIASLPVVCLVEEFSTSLLLLQEYLQPVFSDMKFEVQTLNTTQDISVPMYQRHEKIKESLGSDIYDELIKRNQLDIKLYAFAQGRFNELKNRSKLVAEVQSGFEETEAKIAV